MIHPVRRIQESDRRIERFEAGFRDIGITVIWFRDMDAAIWFPKSHFFLGRGNSTFHPLHIIITEIFWFSFCLSVWEERKRELREKMAWCRSFANSAILNFSALEKWSRKTTSFSDAPCLFPEKIEEILLTSVPLFSGVLDSLWLYCRYIF